MQSRLLVGYIKMLKLHIWVKWLLMKLELVTAGFLKNCLRNASDEEITLVNALC